MYWSLVSTGEVPWKIAHRATDQRSRYLSLCFALCSFISSSIAQSESLLSKKPGDSNGKFREPARHSRNHDLMPNKNSVRLNLPATFFMPFERSGRQ